VLTLKNTKKKKCISNSWMHLIKQKKRKEKRKKEKTWNAGQLSLCRFHQTAKLNGKITLYKIHLVSA